MRSVGHASLLSFFLLLFSFVFSQIPEKGRPFTQYYSPSDYGAGSNTFNVVRDSLGIFYFSNDEGVLLFDGTEWSLIPISDNKPVYWVEINHDGTILVASTGDIGYLASLENGKRVYKSLLAEDFQAEFENVWEIAVTSREAIFRSKKLLISYRDRYIKPIESGDQGFDVAFTVRDTVYTRVRGEGLAYVENDILVPVPGGDFFVDTKLNSYLPYEDKILIGTRSGELFLLGNNVVERFQTEADDFLKKYKLYDGCITQSGNYAYSAPLKGVAVLDKNGKLLQILDESSGLPAHQYLFVGAADPSSLWMTHAVGISRAEILSPISYFDHTSGLEDVVTDLKVHNQSLYVTTLKGFYQYDQEHNKFSKINKRLVQEFHGIGIVGDKIFVGGQDGLMLFQSGKLKSLTKPMIHKMNVSLDQSQILTGRGEGGFDMIQKNGMDYQILQADNFSEPIKNIIPFENQVSLVSQFGKLLMVDIKNKKQVKIEKETSFGDFEAVKIDDQLLIVTPGVWSLLNSRHEKLKTGKTPVSNRIFKIQAISNLSEDSFWICYKDDKRIDYCEKLIFKENQLVSTSEKFKSGYRIVTIFRGENGIDWFGGDKGVIRFDSNMIQKGQSNSIKCYISSVIVNNDSLINQYGFNSEKFILPYSQKSVQFKFYSDQSYSSNDEILFQYKLVGLNENWSDWSTKTSKEYSNLSPDCYEFLVRAKNGLSKISEVDSRKFEIAYPWYLTIYSLIGYGIMFVALFFFFFRWRVQNLRNAKKRLEKLVRGRTMEVELQKLSLEEQRETLRQINNTKDQLFSIIGHDLRGPLISIQGITSLIKQFRSEKNVEKVDELMDHMNDSVKGLNHLIDNLLSWALNQSGNLKLKKEDVKVQYLVTEAVGVLKETALSKNIKINIELDKELTLNADANSLGTVIRNLLSNAIKFTNENGNIWISSSSNETSLTIEVRDNGIGIPKEKITKIFEPAHTTYGTSKEKGTGLGLALVKDFVELNAGKIFIESHVNIGTSFYLKFPLNNVE